MMHANNSFGHKCYEKKVTPDGITVTSLSKEYLDTIPNFDDNFTIDVLLRKILKDNRQYETSKIISAYEFAASHHKGQKRSSGQDYIIHPLAVALTCLELGMDTDTICAALLHDVVEDTEATHEDVKKFFGLDVAALVDGVTKLSKVKTNSRERQQAENVRKMLFAMSGDIRIMIIKLADRLHNMRTLKYRPYNKQVDTSSETLYIYAPIAHRLAINAIKDELEDLALRYLDPAMYIEIESSMEKDREQGKEFIDGIIERIKEESEKYRALFSEPLQFSGRIKSVYSIYKKLIIQGKSMDEIYDKYAVRVITAQATECYSVMGIVHSIFRQVLNRFKDYISTPKSNGYQSLHTTVLGDDGIPFEVQIRTMDMHKDAEYGITAHWKYKEGLGGKDRFDRRLAWLRQLIETQKTADDVEEIVQTIRTDIAPEDIVVMSPKGLAVTLPNGSTVIDFAYQIHTDIGHKTIGAKVNGQIVSLECKLKTGDVCQIITTKDPDKGPNRAWLNMVYTHAARSKIRSWFKKEKRDENIAEGKKELIRMFRRYHIDITEDKFNEFLHDDIHRHNCESLDDFYASIGYGGISLDKIIPRLKDKYQKMYGEKPDTADLKVAKATATGSIVLDEISDMVISFAHCCNPLPGDDIVGFVKRGSGLSVHTKKCSNYKSALLRNNPEELKRWYNIKWFKTKVTKLQTSFEVIAADRVGLVHDVTEVLLESRVPIVHSSSRALKNGNALFECTVIISNTEQLKNLFAKIKKVKGVLSVDRAST